jgi:hypothetical protein
MGKLWMTSPSEEVLTMSMRGMTVFSHTIQAFPE